MSRPFRENLEVHTDASGTDWIRCTQCQSVLCRSTDDWRKASRARRLPPTAAGPLMLVLEGHFLLEEVYCPTCGVLFDAGLVEQGASP